MSLRLGFTYCFNRKEKKINFMMVKSLKMLEIVSCICYTHKEGKFFVGSRKPGIVAKKKTMRKVTRIRK